MKMTVAARVIVLTKRSIIDEGARSTVEARGLPAPKLAFPAICTGHKSTLGFVPLVGCRCHISHDKSCNVARMISARLIALRCLNRSSMGCLIEEREEP